MSAWERFDFAETTSTNDEVKKLCETEQGGKKLMVTAARQTAGRGRRGRSWISMDGNLFVSFGVEVEPRTLGQITFVIGLSLLEAIRHFAPKIDVKLKWPNDVLVNGSKISGILLEKAAGNYLVVGVGVNVASAPQGEGISYAITSLKEAGITTDKESFLQVFAKVFDERLSELKSKGFAPIREAWLNNAKNLGQKITVNMEHESKEGKFLGIDENGALLLEREGKTEKIYAGDIFYLEEK